MKGIHPISARRFWKPPHHKLCLQVSRVTIALTIIFYFFLNINIRIRYTEHLTHKWIAVGSPRSERHLQASDCPSHPHRGRNCQTESQPDEKSGCVNVMHSTRRPACFKVKTTTYPSSSDNVNLIWLSVSISHKISLNLDFCVQWQIKKMQCVKASK